MIRSHNPDWIPVPYCMYLFLFPHGDIWTLITSGDIWSKTRTQWCPHGPCEWFILANKIHGVVGVAGIHTGISQSLVIVRHGLDIDGCRHSVGANVVSARDLRWPIRWPALGAMRNCYWVIVGIVLRGKTCCVALKKICICFQLRTCVCVESVCVCVCVCARACNWSLTDAKEMLSSVEDDTWHIHARVVVEK